MYNDNFIVCGDLHLGQKSSEEFFKYQKQLVENLVDIAKANNINDIIFLGDVFDNRKSIDIITIYQAKELFNLLKDFNVYIIAGNHDVVYKNTNEYSSLTTIEEYSNIQTIYKPTLIKNRIFLPWINDENKDDALKLLNDNRMNKDVNYVFAHLELSGFQYNKYTKSTGEGKLTKSSFDDYNVYTGHYHSKSTINNIKYTGSPFQLTWIDEGEEKGFYIINNGTELFIKNEQEYFKYIEYRDGSFEINDERIDSEDINKYNDVKILTRDEISDDILENFSNVTVINTNKVSLVLSDEDEQINYKVEEVIKETLEKDEDAKHLLQLYGKLI